MRYEISYCCYLRPVHSRCNGFCFIMKVLYELGIQGHIVPHHFLNSSSLKGKVLIITYETKDVVDKNKAFKDRVLELYSTDDSKSQSVRIVPIINCFKYVWPFKKYCIKKTRENARSLGIRLYYDKSGKMYDDFGMKDDESNVFVVDKNGIVSYFKEGQLNDNEIVHVLKLIHELATP